MTRTQHTLSQDSQIPDVDKEPVIRMAIKAYGHVPGMLEYFNYLGTSRDPSSPNYFEPTQEYLRVSWKIKLKLALYILGSLIIAMGVVRWIGLKTQSTGSDKAIFIGFLMVHYIGLHLISMNRLRRETRTRSGNCRSCDYSLGGHDSLGTVLYNEYELPIGPLQCPECGKRYPLISG